MSDLLTVQNLSVSYAHHDQTVPAVRNVSFSIPTGATLAVVGESGCGKTTLALALMGLLPKNESVVQGDKINFDGQNLLAFSEDDWRSLRGKRIAMIFQDPFSALNPVLTIEDQLQECLILDEGRPNAARAKELLERVQLMEPERISSSFPHQLSGGQRQRVMIAMALARNPRLLILDEPTTALDVTVQYEIIKLLVALQSDFRMSMFFVTHNLALAKYMAKDVAVMYAGEFVESGPTAQVLERPRHSYTETLLKSVLKIKRGPA